MYNIIKLREHPELAERAAEFYSKCWGIPVEAYAESIAECVSGKNVPQWYLCMYGDEIAGGLGVIENDFHKRKDLRPNVAAVFTVEKHRNKGVARKMLDFCCKDMADLGESTLYLLTDHESFYEKCGWEFFCMTEDDEGELARMYRHIQK